jgi:hypothetical protein
VIFSRGFDYWESGLDLYPAHDMYEGFCNYQKALLAEFDRLRAEYGFETIDAAPDPKLVFSALKARILNLLEGSQKSYLSHQVEQAIERLTRTIDQNPAFSTARLTAPEPEPALLAVPRYLAGNGNGNGRRS